LAFNVDQPAVSLRRGDVVAAVLTMQCEAESAKDEAPTHAHVMVDDKGLERMLEVELPPEEYYVLLREHLEKKFPNACGQVLDHLVSTEALFHVAIVSGFSFGVPKSQVLQTKVQLLGEVVGRAGREASHEHVESVTKFPAITSVEGLRGFLGLTNWLKDHCRPEYAVGLKACARYLRKGAEFPMDDDAEKGVALIKHLVATHVRLDAIDELAALSGERELQQVADCCKYGWGGSVYQAASGDHRRLNMLGHFSGLLTEAQTLWQVLSQELYAQLQVTRRRRRILGRIPAVCWTDHANVVRTAHKAEAEEKHVRWVAEIESDGSRLKNISGRSAVLGDVPSRSPLGAAEAMTAPIRKFRDFSLEDYLNDYEAEGLQVDGLGGSHSIGAVQLTLGRGAPTTLVQVASATQAPVEVRVGVLPLYGVEEKQQQVQASLWRQLSEAFSADFVSVRRVGCHLLGRDRSRVLLRRCRVEAPRGDFREGLERRAPWRSCFRLAALRGEAGQRSGWL